MKFSTITIMILMFLIIGTSIASANSAKLSNGKVYVYDYWGTQKSVLSYPTALDCFSYSNCAYVGFSTSIYVLDIADASKPKLIKTMNTGMKFDVRSGKNLWVGSGKILAYWDLTNPKAPYGPWIWTLDSTITSMMYINGTAWIKCSSGQGYKVLNLGSKTVVKA